MNGCFSLVVVRGKSLTVEVGIDRFGTCPVYCHKSNQGLLISDDFWEVASRLGSLVYDVGAVQSMALLGFVTGYRTLIEGITELPQGATHRFSLAGEVLATSKRYWALAYGPEQKLDLEAWQDALDEVLESIFVRHTQAILARGWKAHVPLSGGKDSRLVAGMLLRHGVRANAFSYGAPGNQDSERARQVAEALGLRHCFVQIEGPSCLSGPLVHAMVRRVGMRTRFTVGLGAQLSLREFSDQDVYLPGHPANDVTGDLKRGALLARTEAHTIQHLLDGFLLCEPEAINLLFPDARADQVGEALITTHWKFDVHDPAGSIDRWNMHNSERRKMLSEISTYEQFGHWLLPFCDHDLSDFFARVPIELRYQQRLYIQALLHRVFRRDLAALAKIPMAHEGILRVPATTWEDRFCLWNPSGLFSDWLLARATATKRRERQQSIGALSPEPLGPDPVDHWWYQDPAFRQSVVDTFRDWDGMKGIVDARALVRVLQEPLPRLFTQFAVPALLTLCYFQQIVEGELDR
jgi:asparagine synthase (glutamine-hydrolysing)